MPIVETHKLIADQIHPAQRQVYNGLDCCLTLEIFEELCTLRNEPPPAYDFERALQAPYLELMLRGFLVDETVRRSTLADLYLKDQALNTTLQRMAYAVWDKELNPRSPKQLIDFFYGRMKLPEQYSFKKGIKRISTDRDAMEKLELYIYARPIVATILAIRDVRKQISVLETEVDSDGRMRSSYNIAGTETWRLSSSTSAFGTGSNLQNIAPGLRSMFIADPGKKLCVIDLEQAESREVGFICGMLFGDWTYLDACESGDLHTLVASLVWPKLDWPRDAKGRRAIADQNFYRHYSYRDIAKRGGHGSNYYGKPPTMAKHLKVATAVVAAFQERYFSAFPAIPRWHRWTAEQIQRNSEITTTFGFSRLFFGRPNDDATLREAIAFQGQSPTAVRTNLALYNHWKHFGSTTQLLAQTHDSISFQYDPADEAEIVPLATKMMEIPLSHLSRQFIIPGEAKVGWNWATAHDPNKPIHPVRNPFNPNGLIKYKGQDKRTRLVGLDRPL